MANQHRNWPAEAKFLREQANRLKVAAAEFERGDDIALEAVDRLIALVDTVLLLAVDPGFSGQEFQPAILEKITDLRKKFPDVTIEVDGGINPKTAKQCIEVGADVLISASYIFDSPNLQEAIEALKI